MNQRASRLFVFLAVLLPSILGFADAQKHRAETFSGRIVAYTSDLACLNGNAYWSAIIRVEHAKHRRSEFIQLRFSSPCKETPTWLTATSATQKFRLIREINSSETLKEFTDCTYVSPGGPGVKPCQPIQIWTRVPGTEQDKLPFGQLVQSYRSADLPLAPVL